MCTGPSAQGQWLVVGLRLEHTPGSCGRGGHSRDRWPGPFLFKCLQQLLFPPRPARPPQPSSPLTTGDGRGSSCHGAGPLGYSLPLRASPLHLIGGVCDLQQLSKKLLHFSGPELMAWWLPLLGWGCVCHRCVQGSSAMRASGQEQGCRSPGPAAESQCVGGLTPQLEPTSQ